MSCRRLFKSLFISLAVFFISTSVFAQTQPKFTIIPTTPTTVNLPINRTATVTYIVTNQTKIRRTLTMVPIAGITRTTSGAGVCGNTFTLAHGQSCSLVLPLVGSQVPSKITGGPEVCKTNGPSDNSPDPFLCSQASRANSLNITLTGPVYTIGGTISGLTGNGFVLQNNGADNLSVTSGSATFQFSTSIPQGGSYNVTIKTQPSGQVCLISGGSGSNVTSNITSVDIGCYTPLTLIDWPSVYNAPGYPYTQVNKAQGGVPPYSYSLTGTIPSGTVPGYFVVAPACPTPTGCFAITSNPVPPSNTPAPGIYDYTVTVTSTTPQGDLTASVIVKGTIAPPLTLTATPSVEHEVGAPYSQTNLASGGTNIYSYSLSSGMLPPGTTLNSTTGTVSGTPTLAGYYSYVIKVTDTGGITATASSSPAINGLVLLTATPSSNISVGTVYNQTNMATSGTPGYTFSLYAGRLPAGTTLNPATGTVSGLLTTAGSFNYYIQVEDSVGAKAVAESSGVIDGAMSLVATPSVQSAVGVAYSQINTVTGGTAGYTYSVDVGTLPAGTTLNATTGTVSGTPTTAGPFNYTIKVTDSLGGAAIAPSTGTIAASNFIFVTKGRWTGSLGGVAGADLKCQSAGEAFVPGLIYTALLVTSTRYPCGGGPTNPGCMAAYQSDWHLQPGDVYYNPDHTLFNHVQSTGVFDGSNNLLQNANGVASDLAFWTGIQSVLSGPNPTPLDVLGWAFDNMSSNDSWSAANCQDFTSAAVIDVGTFGGAGYAIENLGAPTPDIWGYYESQSNACTDKCSLSNVWIQGSDNTPCSEKIALVCVSRPVP